MGITSWTKLAENYSPPAMNPVCVIFHSANHARKQFWNKTFSHILKQDLKGDELFLHSYNESPGSMQDQISKIWCQHVNHLMNTGSFATHRLPPVSLVFKPASSFLAWWILGQQTKTRCNLLDPWEPWIVVQNGRAMSQCVPKKRPVYSFCSLS